MKTKLLSAIATIPLVVTGMVTSPSIAKGATVGSRLDFSGNVFGSLNQMDYIDSTTSPLTASPNILGNFQVDNATGFFAPVLMNPSQLGAIRDFTEGNTSGIITQIGPVLNGSDNPVFYIPDFISLNNAGLVNFTFQLETVNRIITIDPNSPNPLDPLINGISANINGTLTDLITNEVHAAVGTFNPNFPAGISVSQFTTNNFLGPVTFNASLQIISVPEPNSNVSLAILGILGIGYGINQYQKKMMKYWL
ncbi:MAG: hypothetical protein RLZZ143_2948 [Cyanobacteriota bacterium]